jgi:hypothetical protein
MDNDRRNGTGRRATDVSSRLENAWPWYARLTSAVSVALLFAVITLLSVVLHLRHQISTTTNTRSFQFCAIEERLHVADPNCGR